MLLWFLVLLMEVVAWKAGKVGVEGGDVPDRSTRPLAIGGWSSGSRQQGPDWTCEFETCHYPHAVCNARGETRAQSWREQMERDGAQAVSCGHNTWRLRDERGPEHEAEEKGKSLDR